MAAHHPLGNIFDDLDQLIQAVALSASELDEFLRSLDDRAAFGCARNRDATPASELEQPLVAEHRNERNTVFVLTPRTGEILRGRQALSRLGFSIGDSATNLSRHLLVEIGGVGPVDLDIHHDASNASAIVLARGDMTVTAPPRPPRPSDPIDHEES